MNQTGDRERLLADVLADESAAGFREGLLNETLALVRRRRRARQAWRAASAVVLIAGLGLVVWRNLPPTAVAPGTGARGYTLVLSQPLAGKALVVTRAFTASGIVVSARTAEVIRTTASRSQAREIDDSELLALLGPKPVALVRLAPHRAELVFVNPEDEEELVRN